MTTDHKVGGSNPLSCIIKNWPGSKVEMQRTANPICAGSIPALASFPK